MRALRMTDKRTAPLLGRRPASALPNLADPAQYVRREWARGTARFFAALRMTARQRRGCVWSRYRGRRPFAIAQGELATAEREGPGAMLRMAALRNGEGRRAEGW